MKKIRLDLATVDVESFAVMPHEPAERAGTVHGRGNTWDPPTCMQSCGYTWCGEQTCNGEFSCADTCTETRPIRVCYGNTGLCQV